MAQAPPADPNLPSWARGKGAAATDPNLPSWAQPAPTAAAPPEHKGGGGILGSIGHVFSQGGSDLYHAAVNTPGGVYEIAKFEGEALKHDAGQLIHHPLRTQSVHSFVHGDKNPASKKLGQIEADQARATKTSFQHPLRNPGITLLNALAVADAAGAIGARSAAAGATLRETGSVADAAKAGLAPTSHGVRTLKVGGLEVHPETSRSFVGSKAQKASDALLQKAAGRKPGGLAEKVLQRKVGKVVSAEARMSEQIARGPGQAIIALGKKLKPGEQKALQVVAEQAPIEQRIIAASARVTGAKDPAARARHQDELDLLHQAKPLLTTKDGKPVFADGQKKLGRVYDRMAKTATDRETLLKNLGQLTDEASQSRMTKAARVSLGATFEKPTPGKLGLETPGLKTARQRVASLEGRVARGAGGRSLTVPEARVRLDKLEQQHNKALDTIASAHFGPVDRGEVARRNVENAKAARQQAGVNRAGRPGGYSGRKAISRETVTAERRNAAEKIIDETIAKNPDHPIAKRWTQRTDAITQLRSALNPDIGEKINRRALGARGVPTDAARQTRLEGAAAVAREDLARAEKAAASRVKPTGVIGADHFAAGPGAVRIPDVATKPRSLRGGVVGRVGSQGTVGHLKAPGSVTHEYTGTLREHALRRQDTTRLVGESSLEAAKYAGLSHIHDLVRKGAAKTPTREDDIAVRLDKLKSHERLPLQVRKFVDHPDDYFGIATPAENAKMLDNIRSRLFIDPKTLDGQAKADFAKLNEQGKIGWVPRRVLGEFAKPQAPLAAVTGRGPVRAVDMVNNASRFAILYLKPAYAIPNLLGNAALNVLHQGFAAVPNLARASRLDAKLGPELAARIDASMGEGFATSVSAHGVGRLSTAVDKAAALWSKGVDTPFRRSAFLYEARRAGYKTPGQLEKLLIDPAQHERLVALSLRANREIIDYSNLSQVEREVIRRVVFFYPWVKGSTVYAGRLVREHPVKAAVSAQLGQVGKRQSDAAFGAVPSYLEGLIPFGKSEAINPNSAAILQTPAVLGQALAGLATGNIPQVAEASNYFTPALALAAAELMRRNPQTGRAYPGGTNAGQIGRDVLGSSLPQVSLARNLDAAITGQGGSKLYPPSVKSALLQFLVGGVAPRKIDKADLARLAASERRSMARPR